jgi:hypothetical protein
MIGVIAYQKTPKCDNSNAHQCALCVLLSDLFPHVKLFGQGLAEAISLSSSFIFDLILYISYLVIVQNLSSHFFKNILEDTFDKICLIHRNLVDPKGPKKYTKI